MITEGAAIGEVGRVVTLLALAVTVALIAGRLRFPYTLALVLVGLFLGFFHVLPEIQFEPDFVLFLFLPALLFEGAWNLNTQALFADWRVIGLLAVPGLFISLVVIAVVVHWGAGLPFLAALLLGAIVSPTDPVAVLGLLKQLGMPARLRTIVEGESLFNDGVGAAAYQLVLGFLLLTLGVSGGLSGLSGSQIALKTIWLFLGGPLLGVGLGLFFSRVMSHVDDHLIETALTFGVAYGAYVLAVVLGTSGLLAVVAAGLVLGNYGRRVGMSRRTRHAIDDIWEFTSFIANSLLFLLLGHQIGTADLAGTFGVIIWAVIAVFAGRILMIYGLLPMYNLLARGPVRRRIAGDKDDAGLALRHFLPIPELWKPLILLSGLRGALSIALVLTLPADVPGRSLLAITVYGVVLVTLVGQGIGLRLLLPRWPKAEPQPG